MKYEADVKHKTYLEFILFVAKYSASHSKYVIVCITCNVVTT